ncbi:MAG: hypothetical protein OEL53_18820, partial [Rhodospirillales bacterium]|nr:hypothetical protein [Rhodospirillales bacterium]
AMSKPMVLICMTDGPLCCGVAIRPRYGTLMPLSRGRPHHQDEIRTMSAIKPNSTANVEEPFLLLISPSPGGRLRVLGRRRNGGTKNGPGKPGPFLLAA